MKVFTVTMKDGICCFNRNLF